VPASAAPAQTPAPTSAKSPRLGAGQLRGLVEEFLAEHPGTHGPVEIGHALRRSSGAIANALERLVDTGWAERTNDRPKRYRFADGDDTDTDTDTMRGVGEIDDLQNRAAGGPDDEHEGSMDDVVDDFVDDEAAAPPVTPGVEAPSR
jgi:hypothetical protein